MTTPHVMEAEFVLDFVEAFGDEVVIAHGFVEHGSPVFLTTPKASAEIPFGRTVGKGGGSFARTRAEVPYEATIRLAGSTWIPLGPISIAFPFVQPLRDSEFLVVGARCTPNEENACVFSREGRQVRSLQLGDGIQSVQTTGSGEVWVSYCDEGVFGNYGWGGGKTPIGSTGLVCFDRTGAVAWKYRSPAGRDQIVDCYALNAAADAVWAYYYTEFAIARIGPSRCAQVWDTPIRGARAIAADGSSLLLYGSYDDRDTCCLGALGRSAVEEVGRFRIHANGEEIHPQIVEGRGRWLHLVADGRWWRIDLRDCAAQLGV